MRRLMMDFQPVFMAGHSLRDFDASHWERSVRPSVVPAAQATCSVCAFVAEERRLIHADEVWVFPSPPHVVLADVRPLCTKCHEAKDFAQTLVLIAAGVRNETREAEIRRHYCEINGCDDAEFSADFKVAERVKRGLEEKYGCNSTPQVDYGRWARPSDRPRLTADQQRTLRAAFEAHGEVMLANGRYYRRLNAAVRALQEIPLDQRDRHFREIESSLEPEDDFEMWPDHECPWDIKMMKD